MKSLLVALLAAQSASVSARALPYTLEQLERSGVSEDTLAQIENLRVGGEKEQSISRRFPRPMLASASAISNTDANANTNANADADADADATVQAQRFNPLLRSIIEATGFYTADSEDATVRAIDEKLAQNTDGNANSMRTGKSKRAEANEAEQAEGMGMQGQATDQARVGSMAEGTSSWEGAKERVRRAVAGLTGGRQQEGGSDDEREQHGQRQRQGQGQHGSDDDATAREGSARESGPGQTGGRKERAGMEQRAGPRDMGQTQDMQDQREQPQRAQQDQSRTQRDRAQN
ncbi:MAG: hypothetical protein LQ340_007888 [Diploschistes diacapsis]|nr:MAG: hypothetical protein LQ340_007888 [Diploschistes diacapsis]